MSAVGCQARDLVTTCAARTSIRISPHTQVWWTGGRLGQIRHIHPLGVTSGRWMAFGPLWVRLGSRSSWQAEDDDAKMIKPVQP
jgi:hypothetical protein